MQTRTLTAHRAPRLAPLQVYGYQKYSRPVLVSVFVVSDRTTPIVNPKDVGLAPFAYASPWWMCYTFRAETRLGYLLGDSLALSSGLDC